MSGTLLWLMAQFSANLNHGIESLSVKPQSQSLTFNRKKKIGAVVLLDIVGIGRPIISHYD